MGWLSMGIRIVFMLALCVLWSNHQYAHAAEESHPNLELFKIPSPSEGDRMKTLAKDILETLFNKRHEAACDTMMNLGNTELTSSEQLWQQALGIPDTLSNREMRKAIKGNIEGTQKGFQTIVVGRDRITNEVVIAGNIKDVDFLNIQANILDPTPKRAIIDAKIKEVGFVTTDYPLIKKLVQEAFPESLAKIVVIRPSGLDLWNAVDQEKARRRKLVESKLGKRKDLKNRDPTDNERRNAETHYFHAEMQIRTYFERRGWALDGKTIVASKIYCQKCMDNLPRIVRVASDGKPYADQKMRWDEPQKVESTDLADVFVPVTPTDEEMGDDNAKQSVKLLEASGGECSKVIKSARSSCSHMEDFTEVNADEFQKKFQLLSEGERERLLLALDEIGIAKFKGSEVALKEVDYSRKQWKSSVVKGVMEAVSKGTIMFDLIRSGTKSIELQKTAISPKILLESLNQLQEKELAAFAEEHSKFINGEIDQPKSFKGLGFSYKFVKMVNLGMFGKNIIGGVLNGDPESLLEMGGLFVADRELNHLGQMIAAKGVRMVQAGRKVMGTALKVAGPIVGSATLGLNIYSIVGHINQLKYLRNFCKKNDSFFHDRLKSDCKFDMDITIANTVADEVGITSAVVATVEQIFGLLAVDTGPVVGIAFAVVDAVVAVGVQIYDAVETVAKIASSLVGGLSGWERLDLGWRSFWGMDLPSNIQHLLDIKQLYDASVTSAADFLKKVPDFQTCIFPTFHKRNNKPEFEETVIVNFQEIQELHQFRVEPDTPSWGHLDCNPNALADSTDTNDPESVGTTHGYLCHNAIVLTAPDRKELPVFVDSKNGSSVVNGFPHRKHVFLMGGQNNYVGGSAEDVFILNTLFAGGSVDGAGGKNTLVLAYDEVLPKISVEFPHKRIMGSPIWIYNIQRVIGRPAKPDRVVTACSTTYVDLKGAKSKPLLDYIEIKDSVCQTSPVLHLSKFTTVKNFHKANGNFTYQVEFGPNIQVQLMSNKNSHRFIFSNDIVNAHLSFESGSLIIANKIEGKEFQCGNFTTSRNYFTLITQAGLLIKFDEESKSFYGVAAPSGGTGKVLKGLVNYPNRFVLETNSTVAIIGGDKDDTFTFSGTNEPNGFIDGGGGDDTLVIHPSFHPHTILSYDFITEIPYFRSIMRNIENVIGRPGLPEEITANCDVKWLDLKGGSVTQSDIIRIPSQLSCNSPITLLVRNFTTVDNLAISGEFNYRINVEKETDTSSIKVNMDGSATHNYILHENSSSVREISYDPELQEFKIQFQDEFWSGNIPVGRSRVYLADQISIEVLPEVRGVVQVQFKYAVNKSGLPTHPNIFVLEEAPKNSNFTGGQKDDVFLLRSEKFNGQIIGGPGKNSIVLTDQIWAGRPVFIDGFDSTVSVKKGSEAEYEIEFSDIARLFGRAGESDVMYSGCNTTLIDSRGGSAKSSTYDLVHISSYLDCYIDLDVKIQPNLVVFNEATEGEFGYEGDFRGGSTSVFLTFDDTADHKVILTINFLQLENLKIDQGRVNMTTLDNSEFSTDFFIPFGEQIHTQPSIVFQDGLQLKISKHGHYSSTVFGILQNVSSQDIKELEGKTESSGLIQRYRKAAKNTHTNVVMQVDNSSLVSIGSGGPVEILTAVPGYIRNILVENDANETIYRIAKGVQFTVILADQSKRLKVLDLTPIVNGDYMLVPKMKKDGMNVEFSIEGVQVTITGLANENDSLQSWRVLLRETYLNIKKGSNGDFKLVPQPIRVEPKDHDNVVLNTPNLEYDMNIWTNNEVDKITYEPVKHGNDLVFTNLFQNDLAKEVATVVFHDFYKPEVQRILNAKRVLFEVEPAKFINVTSATGENIATFEERESQVRSSHKVYTRTHLVDEL